MRKKSKKNKSIKKKSSSKKTIKNSNTSYTAKDIEVLEGLEPVRKRPGMYIGGTDIMAMHHLVSEVLDNSMDEVVAGFANKVEIKLVSQDTIEISDNGPIIRDFNRVLGNKLNFYLICKTSNNFIH